MAESTIWWLLAGAAVAVELITGTFYLLMLGIGLAAAAVAAHSGVSVTGQIIVAAVFGSIAVLLWHWRSSKGPKAAIANANPDVNIDIGEPVNVTGWNADGTATVKYRGASWTAIAASPAGESGTGLFRIKEMLGNRLVIEKI